MLDKRKKKLAATPKKASNFLLLRSKKSILIALKKHCHLIGSEPHRFILHADIHSGLSVFCLIDDYLIIHTADYLLFNYNKDTKPRLKSKEIHLKNKWIQQFIAPAPIAGRVETCEEYSIFTLYLSPTWDFKQELAPASLREWMREMIGKMMGRYE